MKSNQDDFNDTSVPYRIVVKEMKLKIKKGK